MAQAQKTQSLTAQADTLPSADLQPSPTEAPLVAANESDKLIRLQNLLTEFLHS